MNTKTVAMFCHAIQGITMLEDNIVNTNGDVIHFMCKQCSWASRFCEIRHETYISITLLHKSPIGVCTSAPQRRTTFSYNVYIYIFHPTTIDIVLQKLGIHL